MAKTVKAGAGKFVVEGDAVTLVRNPKTGRLVAVKGVGALKHSALEIRKGLSLTRPIAEQALSGRADERKAG